MKIELSESFVAQKNYNSRNEVFSDSTYLFLLREKIQAVSERVTHVPCSGYYLVQFFTDLQ